MNKDTYIKAVSKHLKLGRSQKKDVLRDLDEMFTSGLEHGDTETVIMERLGSPEEFAQNTRMQFQPNSNAVRRRKGMIGAVLFLVAALLNLFAGRCTNMQFIPASAIGGSDGPTSIYLKSGGIINPSVIFYAAAGVCTLLGIAGIIMFLRKR